jgi:hypothetical protein
MQIKLPQICWTSCVQRFIREITEFELSNESFLSQMMGWWVTPFWVWGEVPACATIFYILSILGQNDGRVHGELGTLGSSAWGVENIWLLFSDCVLNGRSQEMGCSFNSWSCIALSFSIQRMHSCLLIAKDGEHQRRVCPMKKAENKHGTLIIWIYQKTQGTCKSLSISAWVVSRQLTIEPVC